MISMIPMVRFGLFVVGDFCQYWNFNSQIRNNLDILIMISTAKFQKQLNGQTRIFGKGPNFV